MGPARPGLVIHTPAAEVAAPVNRSGRGTPHLILRRSTRVREILGGTCIDKGSPQARRMTSVVSVKHVHVQMMGELSVFFSMPSGVTREGSPA